MLYVLYVFGRMHDLDKEEAKKAKQEQQRQREAQTLGSALVAMGVARRTFGGSKLGPGGKVLGSVTARGLGAGAGKSAPAAGAGGGDAQTAGLSRLAAGSHATEGAADTDAKGTDATGTAAAITPKSGGEVPKAEDEGGSGRGDAAEMDVDGSTEGAQAAATAANGSLPTPFIQPPSSGDMQHAAEAAAVLDETAEADNNPASVQPSAAAQTSDKAGGQLPQPLTLQQQLLAARTGSLMPGPSLPSALSVADGRTKLEIRDLIGVLERDPMYCKHPFLYKLYSKSHAGGHK